MLIFKGLSKRYRLFTIEGGLCVSVASGVEEASGYVVGEVSESKGVAA